MQFNDIKSIVFDCDGVVLNSNKLKTQAFYNAALPYGEKAAIALVSYHIKNGGISRNHKFEYFLANIAPSTINGPNIKDLINSYATEVTNGLLQCEISSCLMSLREKTPDTKWFIVSGGAEDELRKVFSNRSIKDMFDGGIYGSPKTKDQILNSLKKENQLKFPALFLGDSRYDYEAAQRANLDFTFVCEWTEFKDWRSFCQRMKIPHIGSLCDLL